ncbi:MAG: YciI family protein [Acidobacteriota bacterium]|nr:YciI family protein [Acidobacteriota bacterium]
MRDYLLILRDNPTDFDFSTVSPAEMQAIIQRYITWRQDIGDKVTDGQKLRDGEGRVIRPRLGVSDGPFAEAKEVVGGIFMVRAANLDEAVAIASTCPHADFGSIEVREVEPTA